MQKTSLSGSTRRLVDLIRTVAPLKNSEVIAPQASWPLAYDPASGRSRAKICPFRCHQLPGGAGKGDEETCVW